MKYLLNAFCDNGIDEKPDVWHLVFYDEEKDKIVKEIVYDYEYKGV